MTIYAFTDNADGYYETPDIPAGHSLPDWTKGMTATTVRPPVAIIPQPDKVNFLSDLTSIFGGAVGMNAYIKSYPFMLPAYDINDWATVQALIIDAHNTSVITLAQYSNIKTAAWNRHIPLTLP